jgi:hypothetical protein
VNPTWGQIAGGGVGLMTLALILWFGLKLLPTVLTTWERVKTREFEVRDQESKTRGEQAASVTQLGVGVTEMSRVLETVAVETRKSVEVVEILQKVNANSNDQILDGVRTLIDRVERLEEKTSVQTQRSGTGTDRAA